MSSDSAFMNHMIDLLSPVEELTSKPMFGGYGIFQAGAMFGFISGATLYFKVDDSNRAVYEAAGSTPYKPMPYYEIPGDVLENQGKLLEWANKSITIAHAAAKLKRKAA